MLLKKIFSSDIAFIIFNLVKNNLNKPAVYKKSTILKILHSNLKNNKR